MIKLEQPALALHTHDVPGYKYRMEFTEHLASDVTVNDVTIQILLYAKQTANNFLQNVVINCHGSPGKLHIGTGTVIDHNNLGIMKLLSMGGQKVGTIWIVACQVAGYSKSIVRLGDYFCSELAKTAGCYVVSADKLQYVNPLVEVFKPKNCIDNYEGTVYRWDSNGNAEVFKPKKRN